MALWPEGDESRQGVKDPYTGLHAEAIHALWQNPLEYDHMRHGPPYLPDMTTRVASTQRDPIVRAIRKVAGDTAAEIEQHLTTMASQYGESGELPVLLAAMRSISFVHQFHHWRTRGRDFYGDHELFSRVYGNSESQIDQLAERMIGGSSYRLANPRLHTKDVDSFMSCFHEGASQDIGPEEMVVVSLRAELIFMVLLGLAVSHLRQAGTLSYGLDALLQEVAMRHEENIYLLKQRAMPTGG